MVMVSVSYARAHLSELINRVEAGEEVTITRRGRPIAVARATAPLPVSPPKKKLDLERLRRFRERMPRLRKPSHVLIREMRDEDD